MHSTCPCNIFMGMKNNVFFISSIVSLKHKERDPTNCRTGIEAGNNEQNFENPKLMNQTNVFVHAHICFQVSLALIAFRFQMSENAIMQVYFHCQFCLPPPAAVCSLYIQTLESSELQNSVFWCPAETVPSKSVMRFFSCCTY